MPYSSVDEVPDSVPKGKKKQWMEVWNSAYKSCTDDGGSKKDCEATAFAQANGVVKDDSIMNDIMKIFRLLGEKLSAVFSNENRAVSLPDLYNQVGKILDDRYMNGETEMWEWLTDIYMEDGNMFAVIAAGGKLYRSDLDIASDGSDVTMGEMMEVVMDFKPAENSLIIRKQADGSYRMFILTGTTVLNRNGQIDSSELFDKMIKRVEDTGKYPFLDFFHLGEDFYMGTADYLARDGVVVLASIPLENNEISRMMIRAYEKDPEYWGASNSFYPTEEPEMWEVSEGTKIPVYNDGIYHSITILPEKDACSLFTGIEGREEISRMNKRVKDALEKLADSDPEVLKTLEGMVDGVNRSVEDENLIHRENEEGSEGETPEIVSGEGNTTETLEIDDTVIQEVTEQVVESNPFKDLLASVTALTEQVTVLNTTVSELSERSDKRLKALEETEDSKKKRYLDDLPGGRSPKTRVTYRPKDKTVEDSVEGAKVPLQEVANATLSQFEN